MRWASLRVSDNSMTYYCDNFGVEHIPKEMKKNYLQQKYHDKYLQNTGLLIHIGFMAEFTSLFSPHIYEKNDKVTLNYFFK